MDDHRAARQALSDSLTDTRRPWPLVIRRAVAADRDAVLEFATKTWDGWDYIPHAWPVWLDAPDGVLLVGVPGPAEGTGPAEELGPALDATGEPLPDGRPICVARVAMVSPTEAWLEGIRVHPRVRGMSVATDLQVSELHWAAAQGASVVRYATGQRNEGSHRLGARHGFETLGSFRTFWWSAGGAADDADEEEDDDEATGFDPDARRLATEARLALLGRLAEGGLVVDAANAADWWRKVSTDATFVAGHRLYEHRAWALQELTLEAFQRHVARGEVIGFGPGAAGPGEWALAILPAEALPAEDVSLHLALLVGRSAAALRLVSEVQRLADAPVRFRLPDSPDALGGLDEEALSAAGFVRREWMLDILGRPLDPAHPPPAEDPANQRSIAP